MHSAPRSTRSPRWGRSGKLPTCGLAPVRPTRFRSRPSSPRWPIRSARSDTISEITRPDAPPACRCQNGRLDPPPMALAKPRRTAAGLTACDRGNILVAPLIVLPCFVLAFALAPVLLSPGRWPGLLGVSGRNPIVAHGDGEDRLGNLMDDQGYPWAVVVRRVEPGSLMEQVIVTAVDEVVGRDRRRVVYRHTRQHHERRRRTDIPS